MQQAALIIGVLFLVVGGFGFVPGFMDNLGSITLAPHHSEAKLLGIFQVSISHNILHLMFGVAGWQRPERFLPVNPADDILQLLLGITMVLIGLVLNRSIVVTPGEHGVFLREPGHES